jgi:sulfate transport system ATP-binding protein
VPTFGRVLFDGEDALKLTVQQRNVGLVFQNYALFRHMNVLDNIGFGFACGPGRGGRAARRSASARSSCSISCSSRGSRSAIPRSSQAASASAWLSPGARHRAARALLDEPFGALDAKVRRDLASLAVGDPQQDGHTTVFVTHDQEEALELADRVVVMSEGRIEQIGTPDEIYDAPNSPFVFSFIGRVERAPVRVEHGKCGSMESRSTLRLGDVPDGPAQLFLRPHDVDVVDAEAGAISGR